VEKTLVEFMLANAALTALVSTRINWQFRPQGGLLPAIVLHRISGVRDYAMEGPTGLVESRVQIDCWASTHLSAITVAQAVRTLLSGIRRTFGDMQFQGVFIDSERHDFEKEGNAAEDFHRVSMDFKIWHSE